MITAIYLIDDDETTRFLGQIQYAGMTESFQAFENAKVFEEFILKQETIEGVIILDMHMPVMDGKTFLKRNTEYLSKQKNLKLFLCSNETIDKDNFESQDLFEIKCISKQDVISSVILLSEQWK